MTLKTAKDMPPGAEVATAATLWTKTAANSWRNEQGETAEDRHIDFLLAVGGATIMSILVGAAQMVRLPTTLEENRC